ncbi:MAG: NAD+ synthase [Bacteroidales bacterium]|nr:NAD+ synthase [Bacteroidales bacterium]
MKIALAQLNYKVGDFDGNTQKMLDYVQKAKQENADLVVFSELSVCGYPPLDFLENRDFIQRTEKSIRAIAKVCQGITAIVGAPVLNPNAKGKKLFNSALVLRNGKIENKVNKTLLPTYDIFDEYRYFEPNTEFKSIEIDGYKIALTICEDLWDDQPVENSFAQSKLYTVSPLQRLNDQFDLIINIAASPFSTLQSDTRKQVLINNAKRYQKPLVYVNQTAANTELIFDGQSMFIDAKGTVLYQLKQFEEDFVVIDTKTEQQAQLPCSFTEIESVYQAIKLGLSDYFKKMGFSKAVLGLSGGIDSAVVATIAVQVLGKKNVVGLLMPSKFSSDHSITDAVDLAKNLGIEHHIISIKEAVSAFDSTLMPVFDGTEFGIAEENIQARIRGTLLMAYSNKFGHILLNTSNKSEAAVGYSTLYGDMNGGLSILGDVYKTKVFELANWLNRDHEIIPRNTIVKPPSAELRPDQKDSDSLPDYDILDQILVRYIEKKESIQNIIDAGFEETTVKRTVLMVNRNEYKRFQSPPILRITGKAFGMGRRMPLVAKYDF